MHNRLLVVSLIALAVAVVLLAVAHCFVAREKMWRFYRRSCLALAVLALLGLAAEIASRIAFPEIDMRGKDWAFLRQFSYAPLDYSNNSRGFREREFADRPADGVVRIVNVGDSITEGDGISIGDRLSEMLQQHLNEKAERFEVINVGHSGHEYPDHIETLKKVLPGMHPDFILLQWFVNDLEGWEKSRRPHYLPLLPSARVRRFMEQNSVLYKVALKEWQDLQVDLGWTDTYWDYMDMRFKDEDGADYRRAQQDLDTILTTIRDAGVPMAMLLYPEFISDLGPNYRLGYLIDRVLATCRRYDLTCIDLRPFFDGSMTMDQIIVSRVNIHPTRHINELATGRVLEVLGPTFEALKPARGRAVTGVSPGDPAQQEKTD